MTVKKTIILNGGGTYCEISGEGFPLVLIHGGMADCRMWEPQIDDFSEHFTVIRYDIRGFGKSDPPSGLFSPSRNLILLMDKLGIDEAFVLGFSLGGTIAIDLSIEYGKRVNALAVVSAVPSGFSAKNDERWDKITRAIRWKDYEKAKDLWLGLPMLDASRERPGVFDTIKSLAEDNMESMKYAGLPAFIDPPAIKRLQKIEVPVLVAVGERDVPRIFSAANRMEMDIIHARKTVVAGAGHHASLEKPEEFNDLMINFFTS